IDSGDRTIVGVNRFASGEQPHVDLFEVPESTTQRQIAQLRDVRARRDAERVRQTLAAISEAAAGATNLMPPIIDAVREYATVGEICQALAGVFGEFTEATS
ncbi:MAG TPA: methylmalonyl-CoA mutase family protein, partial [Lacipirellulaceae bacterium]|nr:methylmalonyl-CoA mutase family protein [Lacipirellulaceae bacterium]